MTRRSAARRPVVRRPTASSPGAPQPGASASPSAATKATRPTPAVPESSPHPLLLPILAALLLLAAPAPAQDDDLAFLEAFALGDNRAGALELLLPGSDASWFHRCLLAQHEGRLDDVPALLDDWRRQHGRTGRVREIELRQALLRADAEAFAWLRDDLDLRYDHRRTTRGEAPGLPTALDPTLVSRQAVLDRARSERDGVESLQPLAWPALLAGDPLSDDQLADLLQRVRRPDLPGLIALLARDLARPRGPSFGSRLIHSRLTGDQLDALALVRPTLRRDRTWLKARVATLAPGDHEDVASDTDARRAWLLRLETFARDLPAVHNSFKAHVLSHLLELDLERGLVDRARFLQFLRLPRRDSLWPARSGIPSRPSEEYVQPGQDFGTGLATLGDSRSLVRTCLERLFAQGDGPELYSEFLDADVVRRLYAETRLLHGLGDDDDNAALLDDPAALAALRDRIELRVVPGQPPRFAPGQAVTLDVEVKHVDDLLVKLYEVDVFGHLDGFDMLVEEPTDPGGVDLSGLVPHHEQRLTVEAPPLRRVRRTIDLPQVDGPGVWIVELVGGGLTARSVLRLGQLTLRERVGAAGHVLTVLDDDDQPLPGAEVWVLNRRFTADAEGRVLVPFTDEPGWRPVVLRHGERADLAGFEHVAESYSLEAGLFVDREALLADGTATIVVRPRLRAAGQPASVTLLEDVRLEIAAVDHSGSTSRLDRPGLILSDTAETVVELPVPQDLMRLELTLTGAVPHVADEGRSTLRSATLKLPLNVIDGGAELAQGLLSRTSAGWLLELRGKNGEPLAERPVNLDVFHEFSREPITVSLQTDPVGRVALGPLPGVEALEWLDRRGGYSRWELWDDAVQLPDEVVLAVGETLRLAVPQQVTRASLFEWRGDTLTADHGHRLRLDDGLLTAAGLPAGTHELWLADLDEQVMVRVVPGRREGDWIHGPGHDALAPAPATLRVSDLTADDEALTVELADAGPDARVHVLASRTLPVLDPGERLALRPTPPTLRDLPAPPRDEHHPAGPLGDEARYILDRRFAEKHPGNLLPRPRLVLNPWERDQSFSASGAADVVGIGGGAGGFGGRGKLGRRSAAAGRPTGLLSPHLFATFDFLAAGSVLLTDLRPDEAGRVVIPRTDLGAAQLVSVVAIEGEASASRSLPLAPRSLRRRDRRLADDLVLAPGVTEQRRIDVLTAGQTVVFEDVATTRAELYASLDDVFGLFSILGDGDALRPFRFLTSWPSLSTEEKLARYDEFACHELHLFLHQKDRVFFDGIVRPYLANKRHKTFLDHWLLDHDLAAYLEPARFAELNVVERILLGRRVPAVADAVVRQLADVLSLRTPDPARRRIRFEQALGAGNARSGDSLGRELARVGAALREVLAEEPDLDAEELDALRALGYMSDDTFDSEFGVNASPLADEASAPMRAGSPGLLTGRGRKMQQDLALRFQPPQLYRGPGATRATVEQHYWKLPLERLDGSLIALDAFWVDLAATPAGTPFLSEHVLEPTGNLHAMLLALALLDLPFEAEPAERVRDGHRLTVTVPGPALLVNEVLAPAETDDDAAPLLLSQDLYRLDERYRFVDGQRRDAFVEGELLTGVPYGCQVVLTNPGSAPRDLELLVQIPAGSLPVKAGQVTTARDVHLEPFATTTLDVHFYLPSPGTFRLAPARVAVDGVLVARAEARELTVVDEPSTVDTSSWEHVSQDGSLEQVLAYLEDANLARVDLSRIAWRLQDRAAFDAILGLLRRRLHGDSLVWSYGLFHGDRATSREFLSGHEVASRVGLWLDAPLLSIDPEQRRWTEHVDFDPLINARAHPEGGVRVIRDTEVQDAWRTLLSTLRYRPSLDDDDRLAVLYHLLLQDRIGEALEQFTRIDPQALEARLQFDYVQAYLAFFGEDPFAARELAQARADHPVARWRERFGAVLAQLDEATWRPGADEGDADGQAPAAVEPALELTLEQGELVLRHEGLETAELRFTPMDVELLFSMEPFGEQGAGGARSVRPHGTLAVTLDPAGTTRVALPEAFARRHVRIEARAGGLERHLVHYAHDLSVQLHEQRGELTVRDPADGAPLPGVYVKVYARTSGGRVQFHKDGYTDLRGRFDYVALSSDDGSDAREFAVLVLDDVRGAVVREAGAPAR